MRAARLTAAGAAVGVAAGVAVMGMAGPALAAAPAPRATVTPNPFQPGAGLTIKVTDCTETPTGTAGQVFTGAPTFSGSTAAGWTARQATKKSLQPGRTYKAVFTCLVGTSKHTLTLSVNPAMKPVKPLPPRFSFGYDDVKLSTRKVIPGKSMGFTVTCPTAVTITGNAFTTKSLVVKRTSADNHEAVGTFRTGTLPDPSKATVACKGHGYVSYTTKPGEAVKPGKQAPTIPVGAPDTGDGSLYMPAQQDGSMTPVLVGGSAAALAVVGGGLVLLRRRNAGQEQA